VPELPEVETVRHDLSALTIGARIVSVQASHPRTIRRVGDPERFAAPLRGETFTAWRRHGKYLLGDLDAGQVLVVHLRMSGQVLITDANASHLAHTHVVLGFEDGREFRFVDPRTFGELFLSDGPSPAELAHIGPDAYLSLPSATELRSAFATRRNAAVKTVLCDQGVIAGIGNIYGDEICHVARVRPTRAAASLRPVEVGRVREAITSVLTAAVHARGSSLADAQYVDVHGNAGGFQAHHAVYARANLPCPRCGRAIRRAVVAGRSVHWCPGCQR
jgi:formamidopyrimidine-DNA glycosylase